MDPNANLKEMLDLANNIVLVDGESAPGNVDRLAELVLALDDWIRGGGFLPTSWQRKP